MNELALIQIYYKDEHINQLYSFSQPYKNTTLTNYFENSVIGNIVPIIPGEIEKIGICSWRLRQKRGDGSTEGILKRAGTHELTEERIIQTDFDVAILTPRSPSHKPLAAARGWHNYKDGQYTGAWDNAFVLLKRFLTTDLGIKVPYELKHTIYENHFIAKGEIYRRYVSQCLIPVLQFCDREKGIFEADSGYIEKKRNDPQAIADYQRVSGRADWPIAVFLIERLFSIYIDRMNLKVVNL